MNDVTSHAVWDAGTRWFHWINVLCFLGLVAAGTVILNADGLEISNPGKIKLKTVHTLIGYAFTLNLLWRFVWAFFGNRYARWRAILPGGKGFFEALRSYVSCFMTGRPEFYAGHNPAARVSVTILFTLLTVQAITGLVLAGTDLFFPPFGHWIAEWVAATGVAPETLVPYAPELYDATAWESMRAFRKPIVQTHEINFYVLAVFAILHVAGVIVTDVREGSGMISAMFTGRKFLRGRAVDQD